MIRSSFEAVISTDRRKRYAFAAVETETSSASSGWLDVNRGHAMARRPVAPFVGRTQARLTRPVRRAS
jgi:hypothetical protein